MSKKSDESRVIFDNTVLSRCRTELMLNRYHAESMMNRYRAELMLNRYLAESMKSRYDSGFIVKTRFLLIAN